MASAELQRFLDAHKPHFNLLDNGKIQCELNGHTFPQNVQSLQAFANGLKYQRLRKAKAVSTQLSKYQPFIVPSKNFPTMLYCALTGQLLEKSEDAVKRHIEGKKYTKIKHIFETKKAKLRPEPDVNKMVEALHEDTEPHGAKPGEEVDFWVPDEEVAGTGDEVDRMEGTADDLSAGMEEMTDEPENKKQLKSGVQKFQPPIIKDTLLRHKKKRTVKPSVTKKMKV